MEELRDFEKHEAHVVTTEPLSEEDQRRLATLGFHAAEVVGHHPYVKSAGLFSYYGTAVSECKHAFKAASEFIRMNPGLPLLAEREIVGRVGKIPAGRSFDVSTFKDSVLWNELNAGGRASGDLRRSKVADIHLSVPCDAVPEHLKELFSEVNLTYILIRRSGEEDIPGGVRAGETWISYTIQFDGPGGRRAAERFFQLFADHFSTSGGLEAPSILKLEYAVEVCLAPSHPGIPSLIG